MSAETAERYGDPLEMLFENAGDGDGEKLFTQLEWVDDYADLLPNFKKPARPKMPWFLTWAPAILRQPQNGHRLRIAVQPEALPQGVGHQRHLHNRRRLPLHSHIRALGAQGIAFRFLLVTPWGWTEIPLAGGGIPATGYRGITGGAGLPRRRRKKKRRPFDQVARSDTIFAVAGKYIRASLCFGA